MPLNLCNNQLKIDSYIYIYRLIYMNLTLTPNQKHTMAIQKILRKESTHNTKGIHEAKKKETMRRQKQRTKKHQKTNNKLAIITYQ